MPRTISEDLQSILDAKTHGIDWTLDITMPGPISLQLATSSLSTGKGDYTNDLERISEIRQTLESPVDRVQVQIQNKDMAIGLHLANNRPAWKRAEAIIGRFYTSADGELAEWIEMFRGAVQQPLATDLQVSFDLVPDTISKGLIVSNRTLGLPCGFRFKDPQTCAYSGLAADCNHHLKSSGGCDGRDNSEHFGGTESRYDPDSTVPGTGNNSGGGGDDTGIGLGTCFTLDTPIWTPSGEVPIGEIEAGMKIVSFDEYTGVIDLEDEVEEVFEHETEWYITFEVGKRTVNVTPEHRFFRGEGRWAAAGTFRIGETLRVFTGEWADPSLDAITRHSPGAIRVRNLRVKKNQTYFANRCGVHNAKHNPLDIPIE